MNAGKDFENQFKDSIDDSLIYYYRLRDSGASFGQGNSSLRFSNTNEYDCFIFLSPHFYPFELKSTQGTSFSIQKTKEEKGKDIKLHQINGLLRASKFSDIFAGFVFNFRKNSKTYWMNIIDFEKYNSTTSKKSINESDIIENNGILITQKKKKIKYTYDIYELTKKISGTA